MSSAASAPSRLIQRLTYTSYHLQGEIAIITLLGKEGVTPWGTKVEEHRVSPMLLQEINPLMDRAVKEARCLVLTGEGRFFSNGMDLNYVDKNLNEVDSIVSNVNLFLGKLLTFPLPTCAALNGHTCALGSMIALAADYRLMGNKGIFFIPGVELGLRYTPGMLALMKAKTKSQMHRDMIIFGKRFLSDNLLKAGIIDEVVWPEPVLDRSIAFMQAYTERGTPTNIEYIKKAVYEEAYNKLTDPKLIEMMLKERDSFGVDAAKAFTNANKSKL